MVSHDDKSLLEQLRIGMKGGTLVSAPTISTKVPPHIAEWTFPLFGPYEKTFVVSNMATHPAASKDFEPVLQLAV